MLHYTAFGDVKKINNKIISKPRIIEGMANVDTRVDTPTPTTVDTPTPTPIPTTVATTTVDTVDTTTVDKKDAQHKLSDENKSLDINGNLNITGVLRATQYANFPKDNRLEKLKISNTSNESDDNVMLEIGDDISGNLRFGLNNGYSQFESINLGGAEPQFKFVTAKTKNDNSYEYSEVATINENKLILPKSLCLGETCINEEQLKKILGENS